MGNMSNGCFGAPKGGAIAKAYPKSGLWSCVHTIGMLKIRSQFWFSTAQTLHVIDLFLTINYTDLLLHTVKLHSLKPCFQFYECQIQAAVCRGMRFPSDLVFLLV